MGVKDFEISLVAQCSAVSTVSVSRSRDVQIKSNSGDKHYGISAANVSFDGEVLTRSGSGRAMETFK